MTPQPTPSPSPRPSPSASAGAASKTGPSKRIAVIGVDPGKKTGIALWSRAGHQTWEVEQQDVREYVVGLIEKYVHTHRVVLACERFFINRNTHKKTAQPAAIEILGSLRDLVQTYRIELLIQPASLAKRYPDKVLRAAELFTPGTAGHANDAMRHVLVALLVVSPKDIVRLLQLDTIDAVPNEGE